MLIFLNNFCRNLKEITKEINTNISGRIFLENAVKNLGKYLLRFNHWTIEELSGAYMERIPKSYLEESFKAFQDKFLG